MQCWLVEREFDDKGMVRLVYATPDGSRRLLKERSAARLGRQEVTAGINIDPDRLGPVTDPDRRERYASEAKRMSDRHEPEDTV